MKLDADFFKILETSKKARYPYVWIVSTEETRTFEMINSIAVKYNNSCFVWDGFIGWKKISSWLVGVDDDYQTLPDILSAESTLDSLQNILDYDEDDKEFGEAIFVYPDFHLELNRDGPSSIPLLRFLKWVAPRIAEKKLLVVFMSYSRQIPQELEDLVYLVDVSKPKYKELLDELDKLVLDTPNIVKPSDEIKEQVVRAALGLTKNQSNRLFAKAIVNSPKNPESWVNTVTFGKKEIISGMDALEYYSPMELRDDLGGLEVLKGWLALRKKAFSIEAKEYFLPQPKGVGLIGIPGTGKSLTAKFIAARWRLPLIRFDIGAVFGSYVGQSEETMRNALNLAETVAPCVLWIDEIEKAFPKDAGGGDSGTSTRVLASFLTWMQEKRAPVFVVATANDVTKLPPELLRKGRFDEIFFLNIPSEEERREIFEVHIRRVKREPRDFDVGLLAKKSENFVGAEIEEVIKSGLYSAFNDEGREPVNKDFFDAIKSTVPLFESRKDDLRSLTKLVENKEVVNASKESEKQKQKDAPARKPKLDT